MSDNSVKKRNHFYPTSKILLVDFIMSNDSGAAVTSVTYEAVDNIQKNFHAVSQYGYRHLELLQSLSVLIYNKSAACAELPYSNFPMLLC